MLMLMMKYLLPGAQAQYESDGEVVSCVETEADMDIYGEADEEV